MRTDEFVILCQDAIIGYLEALQVWSYINMYVFGCLKAYLVVHPVLADGGNG